MRASVQAGPPGPASALSRMRAWVSFLAAALPAAIKSCKELRSSAVSVTLYFFMAESSQGNPMKTRVTGTVQVNCGEPLVRST